MDAGATGGEDGPALNNGRASPDASPDVGATPGTDGVDAVDDLRDVEGAEGPGVSDAPDDVEEPTSSRARR